MTERRIVAGSRPIFRHSSSSLALIAAHVSGPTLDMLHSSAYRAASRSDRGLPSPPTMIGG